MRSFIMSLSISLKKVFVAIFMFIFVGVFFAACNETDNSIKVDDVVINHEEYRLVVGTTFQIEAYVVPEEAGNKGIIYRSSNPGVVTVDTNGLVRGVSAGQAQVYATSDDGKMEANCLVTVVERKTTRSTLTNLKYDSSTQRISWDATNEMVNGVTPTYEVSITKTGEQRATKKTVITNYLDNIGVNGDIVPGNEYSVKVRTLGDEYYYNDSAYTSTYVFTILAAPSQAPVVEKENENLFLSVPSVEGQTDLSKYELVLKKYATGTRVEQDLSLEDKALFETDEYTNYYPASAESGTKVRWLLPSTLSSGEYIAKVRIVGDEQNRVFNSAFVTSGENVITKLQAPTGLALTTGTNGTTVSWNTVKNATNYRIHLVTNEQTYISKPLNANQTSCLLAPQNFYEQFDLGSLVSYYVYMQTIGNNELYQLDSAVSANCATLTLATPTGLTLTKGEGDRYTLTWSPVANAEGYVVTVRNETTSATEYVIDGMAAEKIFSSSSFALNRNSVQVRATSTARNVSNSLPSAYLTVIKLSAPSLETNTGRISWAQVEGATGYQLSITSEGEGGAVNEVLIDDDGSANYAYSLGESYISGEYSVAITAIGNSSNIITSVQSEEKQFTKLGSPEQFRIITQNGIDYLQWQEVTGATNYQIEISQDSSSAVQTITTTGTSYGVTNYMADFAYGEYDFRIRAYGTTSTLMSFLNSEYTDSINAFRLSAPNGLSIRNGLITWNRLSLEQHGITSNLFNYELNIGNAKRTVTPEDPSQETITFDTNTLGLNAGSHSVSLRAVVAGSSVINGSTYLLSSPKTSNITMYKLASPSNISLTSVGSLTWDTVTSLDGIEIGSYTVMFKYANGNTYAYSASSNECPKSVVSDVPAVGRVEVRIIANGGSNYLSSQQSTLTKYSKLATPAMTVSYGELKWSYVKNEGKDILNYKVFVREDGTSTARSYDVNSDHWDMSVVPGGKKYYVSIQACGTTGGTILSSDISPETDVRKLLTPDASTIRATSDLDGVMWDIPQQDLSFTYDVTVTYVTATDEIKTMATESRDDNSFPFPDDTMWPGGTYQIKIRTKASGNAKIINSDYSNVTTVTRLATPTGLSVSNSILTWNEVQNAYNYKANAAYGTAAAKDISTLVVNEQRRIVLNVDGAEELRHELATFVGSITLSVKAIASSASSGSGILINSATSLTKTVERYSAPEISITAENKITFATQLASTRGNVLIFTPNGGGASTQVTLRASETVFDMDCSRTYDDDATLTENVEYLVSIKALGDGQATLDSPESAAYASSIVKLSSPDYKVTGTTRTAGNWRVENGVLVWDLIPGAKSYRVVGVDDQGNSYDSGNITPLEGRTTASCLPTIPQIVGTITFNIIANGGVGENSVQYITSQPTTTKTVHKLGTPDDLRVENGEIEWEGRDSNDRRTIASTVTISGQPYTILTKYVVSYGEGASQELTVDERFILSDYISSMQRVSVAVQAIGTANSIGVNENAVYLSSNSTYALTVTILDQPTEFGVVDGVLTWVDQNDNNDNFELILIGDTGYDNKILKLDGNSTDLSDAEFVGQHYREAYIRHYGSEEATYLNPFVNSPISAKITNLIKLPSITTYGINEDGDFNWELSSGYTGDMQVGRTLSLTINDEDPIVVSSNTYTLDTSGVEVTSVELFNIKAFVQGSETTSALGNNYLKSNQFDLTTYKFAPVSMFASMNGLQISWSLNDYEIIVDNGQRTVGNNKYIIQYQFSEFGDSNYTDWQEIVITGTKVWGLSELGNYKIRIYVASVDMDVLRSQPVTYNGVFAFNKFESGNGTPDNPFIISDTTDGGVSGYTERSTADEKLSYIFIISDKFFKLGQDITLDDSHAKYYSISNARTFSYASTNMPYTSSDYADIEFTGGLDGAGYKISNYKIDFEQRTAIFKTVKGDYRTYTDQFGNEVSYDSNTCTDASVKFWGRSGIIMNLELDVSEISYSEAEALSFDDGIAFMSHYSYGGWFVNCHVKYTNENRMLLNLSENETLVGGLVCYMSSFEPDVSVPKFLDARVVGCSSQIQWSMLSQLSTNCIRMGGLVAQNEAGLILACESRGTMQANTVGGIAYYNTNKQIGDSQPYLGVISGCENKCTRLTGLPTSSDNGLVGGICARNRSYVMFCKNSGMLTAINYFKAINASIVAVSAYVGGICGDVSESGRIFNCLSVGQIEVSTAADDFINVNSSNVGGLFATNSDGTGMNILNCMFDEQFSETESLSTNLSAGGNSFSIENTSFTTAEIKAANTIVINADEELHITQKNIIQYLNFTGNLNLDNITNLNYMMGSVASLFDQVDGEYPTLDKRPSFS